MPATYTDRLQGLTTSVAIKAPCRAATTAPITLSGLQTIDGVVLAARDRVLVKDQAAALQNGIYNAASGGWPRALDFDGTLDAVDGTRVSVREGDVSADTYFKVVAVDPIIVGTSDIDFILVSEQPGPPGPPGGNVMAIGLFTEATGLAIPTGANIIQTSGFSVAGKGAARYSRWSAPMPALAPAGEGFWWFQDSSGARFQLAEAQPNVRQFGAAGDNVTVDTLAFQSALDRIAGLNNTSTPAALSSGGGEIFIPAGDYRVAKLVVPPGAILRGENMWSSRLRVVAGHADNVIDIQRPTAILTSFTRGYCVRDLGIFGNNTAGSKGIFLKNVAEVDIRRVLITGCDYGIDGESVVTGSIDLCKIYSNVTRGARFTNGSNAINFRSSRLQTTISGANVEIDGGSLRGFAATFVNCIIESALDTVNGQGILIGAVNGDAQAVGIINCYFESNRTHCIQIGSSTSTIASSVTISGGFFTKHAVGDTYGVQNFGGNLSINGAPYLESISVAKRIVCEPDAAATNPRVYNITNYTPTGSAADAATAVGFSAEAGIAYMTELVLGGHTSNRGLFVKRTSDVAYQGDVPLWIQQELRTNYQGRATLVAGVITVTFSVAAANAAFLAFAPVSSNGNRCKVTAKTTGGFTITAVDGAGATVVGDTGTVDWFVLRNQ